MTLLFQRWLDLQNLNKIQRLSNTGTWRWFNSDSTLKCQLGRLRVFHLFLVMDNSSGIIPYVLRLVVEVPEVGEPDAV